MFGGRARASIALLITIAGLAVATPASAEWFVDLYLGGAFTEKHDGDTEFPGGVLSALNVSFNNSFTGGLRGGHWLPFDVGPLNCGFGVDFSHFAPNIGRQSNVFCRNVCVNGVFDDVDLSVWVIGFDALLRAPLLKSATFRMASCSRTSGSARRSSWRTRTTASTSLPGTRPTATHRSA
jgi:hypothetical protein